MTKAWAKGLTYEQMYGVEKAADLKRQRGIANSKRGMPEIVRAKLRGPRPKGSTSKQQWWAGKSPVERRALTANWQQAGTASVARNNSPTSIELAIQQALDAAPIAYVSQYRVGRYLLDFYLPELNVALECDGAYWHSSERAKRVDAERDSALATRGIQTIRLPESLIRQSPSYILSYSLMATAGWIT